MGAASQGWVLPTPLPLCLDRWRAVLRGGITVSCAAESQVCRLVSCQWVCPSRRAAPGPQCVTGAHLRGPQATWWACGRQVPSGALAFSLCQASCRQLFHKSSPSWAPTHPTFSFCPRPPPSVQDPPPPRSHPGFPAREGISPSGSLTVLLQNVHAQFSPLNGLSWPEGQVGCDPKSCDHCDGDWHPTGCHSCPPPWRLLGSTSDFVPLNCL